MEMQNAALDGSWWSDLSPDLQKKILAWLPVEFVYRYRMVSKHWNEFLSSNYFLTMWADAPVNGKQPRLVLCDEGRQLTWMAFCFYRGTWFNPCFTLSFMEAFGTYTHFYCNQSVPGLMFVMQTGSWKGRVCNPYTEAFVDIPAPHELPFFGGVVIDKFPKSNTTYNVVAVGPKQRNRNRESVQIYDPSQKRWNITVYFPEDLILESELVSYHGSFYLHCCHTIAVEIGCIGFFTIPYEGDGSSVLPNPIPMFFAPFPELVKNWKRDHTVPFQPRMITCGSRVLLVAAKWMPGQVEQAGGEGEVEVDRELVFIIWEFIIEEGKGQGQGQGQGHPSTSPSWKWVEIARMPYSLCDLIKKSHENDFHRACCIGVGDYVCFLPEIHSFRLTKLAYIVTYNLIKNRWDCLPGLPESHRHVGTKSYYRPFFQTMPFVPCPHTTVE